MLLKGLLLTCLFRNAQMAAFATLWRRHHGRRCSRQTCPFQIGACKDLRGVVHLIRRELQRSAQPVYFNPELIGSFDLTCLINYGLL